MSTLKKIYSFLFQDIQGGILIELLRYRFFLSFPYVKIDIGVEIWDKKNKKIWRWTRIRKWAVIQDWILYIGENSNIWPYSIIFPWHKTIIGDNVLIGPGVWIFWWSHNFKSKKIKIALQWDSSQWIIIQDDVRIWNWAIILDWVNIKKGSVIGAWSVVTKNTIEYWVYVWNPAKLIYFREDT